MLRYGRGLAGIAVVALALSACGDGKEKNSSKNKVKTVEEVYKNNAIFDASEIVNAGKVKGRFAAKVLSAAFKEQHGRL